MKDLKKQLNFTKRCMDNMYKRIVDISYKHKLSHLGSCLSAVPIINRVFSFKKEKDKFILSSGHSALALYVVNEIYFNIDAEKALEHHGIHPEKCEKCMIDCTTGSLGHGLPIAVGMALSNPDKNYFCLISDGECAEGSIWESLNVMQENNIRNLDVVVNINGFGAYRNINKQLLKSSILAHVPDIADKFHFWDKWDSRVGKFPFLKNDISDHYSTLSEKEYTDFLEFYKKNEELYTMF